MTRNICHQRAITGIPVTVFRKGEPFALLRSGWALARAGVPNLLCPPRNSLWLGSLRNRESTVALPGAKIPGPGPCNAPEPAASRFPNPSLAELGALSQGDPA